jgi:hypothetical protein
MAREWCYTGVVHFSREANWEVEESLESKEYYSLGRELTEANPTLGPQWFRNLWHTVAQMRSALLRSAQSPSDFPRVGIVIHSAAFVQRYNSVMTEVQQQQFCRKKESCSGIEGDQSPRVFKEQPSSVHLNFAWTVQGIDAIHPDSLDHLRGKVEKVETRGH